MTATLRRNSAGRFAARPTYPVCDHCGSYLYQRFSGAWVCVIAWCAAAGVVVGRAES